MTADVYADDSRSFLECNEFVAAEQFTLRLMADADPDLLLRIAAHLNLLNNAPKRLLFERHFNGTVAVMIVVEGCTSRAIDLVCRKLEQLTSVLSVSAIAHSANVEAVSTNTAENIQ